MKHVVYLHIALAGFVIGLFAGCASTEVTNQQRVSYGKLTKPNTIVVYDFTATPTGDIPADSMFAASGSSAPAPTDEQAALARQLGAQTAAELVKEIREMGMPAMQVAQRATPQLNDIVIRGYFASIEKGSAAGRMILGFGAGGSELTTVVEGYQMTATGLRKLGSATVGATGGKGPGAALGGATWLITGSPIGLIAGGAMKVYGEASGSATVEGRAKATAKEIADVLKERFKEQGWIN